MKKANFNITFAKRNRGGKPKTAPIPGYIFYYSGVRFGVSKYHGEKPVAGTTWYITELTTGYAVGIADVTMKAAIDALIRSRLINAIKTAIDNFTKSDIAKVVGTDVNPGLTPKTEYFAAI